MNILEFLLSKKILVVLSGLIFTGVAVASSGAESLFSEGGLVTPQTKILEVQNISDVESSSLPSPTPIESKPTIAQQSPKKSSPTLSPKPTTTPKLSTGSSNQTTITGLRQSGSTEEDDSSEDDIEEDGDGENEGEDSHSEINQAFQNADEED